MKLGKREPVTYCTDKQRKRIGKVPIVDSPEQQVVDDGQPKPDDD